MGSKFRPGWAVLRQLARTCAWNRAAAPQCIRSALRDDARWLSQAASTQALSTTNRQPPKDANANVKVVDKPPPSSEAQSVGASETPFHLTPEEHRMIDLQREALRGVLSVVEAIDGVAPQDVRLLREEIARLGDGFFLLVVAGEYNSGKSSLINALAGRRVLTEGPTPTTAQVTKLKYARTTTTTTSTASQGGDGVLVLGEPLAILANRLQIVDTPGTNAIDRAHESLTRDYIPLCDLVLFVTSADRPFSESERLFLESIRQWGKKVVLVINKMDLLHADVDAQMEVVEFVTTAAKSLLGSKPYVFPLSSRDALDAKLSNNSGGGGIVAGGDAWERCGLPQLEEYVKETLDSQQKFRVKLEASASVGATILDKYHAFLASAQQVVMRDQQAAAEIDAALQRYGERVRASFGAQYARVDNALLHMLDRADIFFDANIRLLNVPNLMQRDKLKDAFETEVIANTTRTVQRQSEAMAEWLTDMSARSISETSAIFARRMGERGIELRNMTADAAGGVGSLTCAASHQMDWSHAEDSLISGLSAAASDLAASYDAINDGKRIAGEVATSVRTALTLQTGAVGLLGALVGTSSLDLTGVTSTGVLATAGLVVLPRRRLALRRELRSRIKTLRKRLHSDLENRVDEHVAAHVTRVRDAMAPFARFTDDKKRAIDAHLDRLACSRADITQLRQRIAEVHAGDEDAHPHQSE